MPECPRCSGITANRGRLCKECEVELAFGDGSENYEEDWPGLAASPDGDSE